MMSRIAVGLAVTVLTLTGGFVSIASGDHPPRPGTDNSSLSENETARLWSKTPDTCLTDTEYEDQYNESRTPTHALGNCTDITFNEPPQSASAWTTHDFASLEPGGQYTSVYPQQAELTDSKYIKEAHATVFAAQPSTRVHLDNETTALYLAPEGELRGLVDYRIKFPENDTAEDNTDKTIEWSVNQREVSTVRVRQDGEILTEQDGEQTPVVPYHLAGSGPSTFTFEAKIRVKLRKEITTQVGNKTKIEYEYPRDRVTVSEEFNGSVYNLTALVYHAAYPDGDGGIAVYQAQPWHGYVLDEDGTATVRGVWWYYTARDTDWDYLVRSTDSGEKVVHSDSLPVYTQAFPSEIGPEAEPVRDGPEIREVWGFRSESPAPALHENVEIGVVDAPYIRSYGLAVQHDGIDRESLRVDGIVRGENATIVEPDGGAEREINRSDLSVEIIDENQTEATVRIDLQDAETGELIGLEEPFDEQPRVDPIGQDQREGYITIGDKRVETNSFGFTTVTIRQPGSYTVEYHPGSWRTHDPAYVGDQSDISWHPLSTAGGWFTFLVDVLWILIPFVVALYAGLKLGSFLHIPEGQ